jgi:hypothetical protein
MNSTNRKQSSIIMQAQYIAENTDWNSTGALVYLLISVKKCYKDRLVNKTIHAAFISYILKLFLKIYLFKSHLFSKKLHAFV